MQGLRPLLTAVLGLTLWVQGLAIATAPIAATAQAASALAIPCHGATDGAPFDCCDSDCPDMAGCVIVPLAGAPATAMIAMPALQPAVATRGWSVQTAVPPFPLRPPIVSHA